nr:cytochrome c [Methylomarinum sp. Ch1-1]MDP4520809.1 cytochrome c [Methylomarinum sp. Ch1-1]
MKCLLPLILLLCPVLSVAEPSTNIAWTPDLLNFVKNGKPKNGQKLAQSCVGCHGEKGVSPIASNPSLAGQLAAYTYKQLRDYADGKREHMLMNSIAQGLSEQDSADLAAWFASLPRAQNPKSGNGALKKAKVLVSQGNGKKSSLPASPVTAATATGKNRIFRR